jgi:hypothetical protein
MTDYFSNDEITEARLAGDVDRAVAGALKIFDRIMDGVGATGQQRELGRRGFSNEIREQFTAPEHMVEVYELRAQRRLLAELDKQPINPLTLGAALDEARCVGLDEPAVGFPS